MPFRRDFGAYLNEIAPLSLLPGFGWFDGGCRILADALMHWITSAGASPTLLLVGRVLPDGGKIADHYGVQVGRFPVAWYLDGHGCHDFEKFIQNFQRYELAHSTRYTSIFCVPATYVDWLTDSNTDIPTDQNLSLQLSQLLSSRFGTFDEDWLSSPS